MSIDGGMDKEAVEILAMQYYSAIKKKQGNPAICDNMDGPWGIMLSEIKSDKDRTLYDLTFMWNLKTNKQTKQNSQKKRSDLW